MPHIPFAETLADWRDAQAKHDDVLRNRRTDWFAEFFHQREAVRCGQQLVRFWPAANDAGFGEREAG